MYPEGTRVVTLDHDDPFYSGRFGTVIDALGHDGFVVHLDGFERPAQDDLATFTFRTDQLATQEA